MWGALIQVGGALLGGAMANQGAQAGADAAMAGNAEAIEEQRRQFNAMLTLMAPAVQSEYARRNVADAFLGVPSSGTGNALNFNSLMGPTYAGGSSTPDGTLRTPLSTANGGLPSLSQKITGGNDPSLYNAISNGNINNEDWWATGGPSLSGQALSSLLGIRGKGDGGSAADQWGTPEQNAGRAQDFDGSGYLSANPDVENWFTNLSDRDARYLATSFDFNGDGKLDRNEAGAGHYYGVGGQKEGRPVSMAPTTTATGTTGATTGAGGNALTQNAAIDMWKASPFYTAAQSGFDQDRKYLEGSAATGGKLLSGATIGALDERGAARANQSAGQFYNALTGGQVSDSASSGVANNTLNYGNSLGNALRANGAIQSDLAQTQSANWMKAMGNASQAIGNSGWLNG